MEIIPKHLHELQAAEMYESLSVDYNLCTAVASNFTTKKKKKALFLMFFLHLEQERERGEEGFYLARDQRRVSDAAGGRLKPWLRYVHH